MVAPTGTKADKNEKKRRRSTDDKSTAVSKPEEPRGAATRVSRPALLPLPLSVVAGGELAGGVGVLLEDEQVDLFPIDKPLSRSSGRRGSSVRGITSSLSLVGDPAAATGVQQPGGLHGITTRKPASPAAQGKGRRRSSTAFYQNSPILSTDWQKNSIFLPDGGSNKKKLLSSKTGKGLGSYSKRRWEKAYQIKKCEKIAIRAVILLVVLGVMAATALVLLIHFKGDSLFHRGGELEEVIPPRMPHARSSLQAAPPVATTWSNNTAGKLGGNGKDPARVAKPSAVE